MERCDSTGARAVNIVVTTKGARLRYQVNALNFHPKLLLEFLKMLPEESQRLSDLWDKAYNRELKRRGGSQLIDTRAKTGQRGGDA